jgi:hypothetical protein
MNRALAGWTTWLPLYLLLALASGFVDLRVRAYPDLAVTRYIPEVVAGTADAPGLYRVLVPYIFTWIVGAVDADPMTVWHVTRLAAFLLAWLSLHAYLRTWFSPGEAVLGVFVAAALLPLTYTNSWPHPDHIPELALFTLGCLAIARHSDAAFFVVLALATLNRETAVFLVPLHAVAAPITRTRLRRSALALGLWASIYLGLRAIRGFRSYEYWQFWRNLEFLQLLPPPYDPYYRAYAWFGIALAGVLAWVALRGRAGQPLFVRRAPIVVPLFFLVSLTLSSIIETRILTPVLPLLLPGLMFTLQMPKPGVDTSR